MLTNYWIERSLTIVENEVVLVRPSPTTAAWFNKMLSVVPAIVPAGQPKRPQDFVPRVGHAHHLRLTKYGIEGVLKLPRKYHRYQFYVLFDKINMPNEPFWIILHRN